MLRTIWNELEINGSIDFTKFVTHKDWTTSLSSDYVLLAASCKSHKEIDGLFFILLEEFGDSSSFFVTQLTSGKMTVNVGKLGYCNCAIKIASF